MASHGRYVEHAKLSMVQGIALAFGFVLVVWLLRMIHPDTANDMLYGAQNHP